MKTWWAGYQTIFLILVAATLTSCAPKDLLPKTSSDTTDLTTTDLPTLSFSTGTYYSMGRVASGTTQKVRIAVNYSGRSPAKDVSVAALNSPFSFAGGSYPGTGGTCGTEIESTCTITISFNSSSVGTAAQTIDLTYLSGDVQKTIRTRLSAAVVIGPVLTISDGAIFNFGTLAVGSSNDKTFTVSFAGTLEATGVTAVNLSAPYSFKGGTYPGTGGTCGSLITSNCTVVVTYAPTTAGASTATLDIKYENGSGTQSATRSIQATAAAPSTLSISDGPTYNFGNQVIASTPGEKTFTVNYSGGMPATSVAETGLSAPYVFKDGSFPGTGGTCSTTISSTCTIVVTFDPTTTSTFNDQIVLSYNNGLTAQSTTRDVTGQGVVAPTLTISDGATYDFGTKAIGSSTDKTFTISHSGTTAATAVTPSGLSAPFTFKGGSYPGTGGTCGTSISANCTIVVTYAPTLASTLTDTLQLDYFDGASNQSTQRAMQGTGATVATITISDGATYNYGTRVVGSATDKTFTLTKGGTVAATSVVVTGVSAPYAFKGGTYPGTGGTCGTTISANCTIVVTYTPTAQGVISNTINVAFDNGVSVQNSTRPITGTGAQAATLSLSDGPVYDYGTKAVSSTLDKTFTVTYSGGVSATTVSETTLSAPFAFKGGTFPGTGGTCTTTISNNCTLVVTFSPTSAVTSTDSFTLSYNNGLGTTTSSIALTGQGATAATLTISDGATYDFGTKANGSSFEKILTVAYAGGSPATSVSASGLSSPFGFKGGSYPGTGGTCGTTISSTCTLVVTYSPIASGTSNATLTLSYNNGSTTTSATRDVSGTGATPATLVLSDSPSYEFGSHALGTTVSKTFTLSYVGGVDATAVVASTLASPFSFAGGTYPGTGGTCGATINSNCTIIIEFSPASAATFSDTLLLSYDNGVSSQTVSRSISGTGANTATLTISDGATYDFGTVALASSADKIFTLTNSGQSAATSVSGSGLAAPYTYKGGSFPGSGGTCTTSLAASASCTFVVTYSPTGAAVHSDTIELSYETGLATAVSSRDVTATGSAIQQIVSGANHSCARFATGIVKCWGSDTSGQLGDGAPLSSSSSPVQVTGVTTATQLAAGDNHTCALLTNNSIVCWGADDSGQLGNDITLLGQPSPVAVSGITTATGISTGSAHTCALLSDGTASCWGSDASGQLGDSISISDQPTPVAVLGVSSISQVSAGGNHSCARLSNARITCWGNDSRGQLGDSVAMTSQPTSVSISPSDISSSTLLALGGEHSCTILTGGSMKCWGSDQSSQLGDGGGMTDQPTPVAVTGITTATQISMGTSHSCARLSDATLSCWGSDLSNQVGNAASLIGVTSVAAGGSHTCALLTSNKIQCWGDNSLGQLGRGTTGAAQATSADVVGL